MNPGERLETIIARLQGLQGLDDDQFNRLSAELDRLSGRNGLDSNGRLKVAMFDTRSYDQAAFERSNGGRHAIHAISAALDADTVRAATGFRVVCLFVNDRCDAEIVAALAERGVELIALRCAGFNNVDLQACREHNITVVRVPAYSPHAVAEHTVALMMMLNRKLHQAYQRNRAGSFVLDGLLGFDMYGKTVGIVGTGKIGQCAVRILRGFGCQVLAFDKYPDKDLAAEDGVTYATLDAVLRGSDVISLHIPLLEETHHLINAQTIADMREGVMLINTSRGGLVDTQALIHGLKSGHIGSAGLDVYEEETGIFFRDWSQEVMTDDVLARLMTFPNVVVTSHQAFLTREALANIADTTLSSIDEFAAGKRGAQLTHAVTDI